MTDVLLLFLHISAQIARLNVAVLSVRLRRGVVRGHELRRRKKKVMQTRTESPADKSFD